MFNFVSGQQRYFSIFGSNATPARRQNEFAKFARNAQLAKFND